MTLCMQITQRNTVSMAMMLLPLAKQRSRYEAFFVEVQGTNLSSGGRILPEACKERQLEGREVKTVFMQCTKVDMQSQGIS